ncbi:unnamed protein product [Lepidochelys olivacea]
MEASLAVCLLAALLATGSCLQCEVCAGQGTSCMGAMQTCPAGQESCAIARTVTTLAGVNTQSIHKHCVTSSQCKAGHVSMNFGKGMTTRTSIACCVGDTCKATIVIVPPADPKPNGRSCRGCYSLTSEQCREETIQCTGSETQCLDTAGTITSAGGNPVRMVMKGCVSQSICDHLQVGSGTVAGIRANLTMAKCTTVSVVGAAPGPAGLLLSALAGLLLLTLLS